MHRRPRRSPPQVSILIINELVYTHLLNNLAQFEEVTKHKLRIQMWRKLKEKQVAVKDTLLFSRIPMFLGADKAAQLLFETEEFKKASK